MAESPPAGSLPRRFSEFVERRLGLRFAPERWPELERGLTAAAAELNFADGAQCAERLMSPQAHREELEVLAAHLTIGETYFFRDSKAFHALENTILPALIRSRENGSRRLRIWSAGCCSGEEPFSIALALERLLPDATGWHLSILGTDISARSLQKAATGVYGAWSFRGFDESLRKRFFREIAPQRYELAEKIRAQVRFALLNLVEDPYPSLGNDTNAMDLIFCRNVLMYFSPEQATRVGAKLAHCLVPGGWLVTSPAEASPAIFEALQRTDLPGGAIFRKAAAQPPAPLPARPPALSPSASAPAPRPDPALLAHELANSGRLSEALTACDGAIDRDRLAPGLHYLRGMILQEQGAENEAVAALKRTLHLDSGFVLAHLSLGHLLLRQHRLGEARQAFADARSLLGQQNPESEVPGSDGMTAGRLLAMLEASGLQIG